MTRELLVDRRETVLETAWIRREPSPVGAPAGSATTSKAPRLNGGAGPVLVFVDADLPAVRESLLGALEAGRRVYVVAALSAPLEELLGATNSPSLLIRRRADVPLCAILGAEESHLRLGGAGAPWLRMNARQRGDLRQVFLRLFWHDAVEEGWIEDGKLRWSACRACPFQLTATHPDASVRLEPPGTPLPWSEGARAHITSGPAPRAVQQLWFGPSGRDHEELRDLALGGTKIRSAIPGLPDMVLTQSTATALLPGRYDRLRMELAPEQRSTVEAMLEVAQPWLFQTSVRLGDLPPGTLVWLPGHERPLDVDAERAVSLGDLFAPSLLEAHSYQPSSLPAVPPLVHKLNYRFRVMVPTAPPDTRTDPLIERWSRVDRTWRDARARVAETLEELLVRARSAPEPLLAEAAERARERLPAPTALAPSQLGPVRAREAVVALAHLENEVLGLRDGADRRSPPRDEHDAAQDVPTDAPPSVGALRVHKRRRFLVIADWEECELGAAESARLGAALVASAMPVTRDMEEVSS
jgi:hypothetical protein